MIIALLALVIVGPERLPETIKSISRWLFSIKHQFNSMKQSVADELGLDEIRRDVHNTEVMKELQSLDEDLQQADIAMSPPTSTKEAESDVSNNPKDGS